MKRAVLVEFESDETTERLLAFLGRVLSTQFDEFTMAESGRRFAYDKLGHDMGNHAGHNSPLIELPPCDCEVTYPTVPGQPDMVDMDHPIYLHEDECQLSRTGE